MLMEAVNVRALYQAIADAEIKHGRYCPEAAHALFELMDYFESIDDRDGVRHCTSWLQNIANRNPETTESIRARALASTVKLGQAVTRKVIRYPAVF